MDYFTCPLMMITPLSRGFMDLYCHYKSGYLAVEGGLLSQPAAYLDAMKIIDNAMSKSNE